MTTKRSVLPFTQTIPLFTERNLPDKGSVWKSIEANNEVESREIFLMSEHPYGVLILAIDPDGDDPVIIDVSIRYKVRGTNIFTEPITIGTIEVAEEPSGIVWRLDAKLGMDWMPNTPYKVTFKEKGGLSNAQITGYAGV